MNELHRYIRTKTQAIREQLRYANLYKAQSTIDAAKRGNIAAERVIAKARPKSVSKAVRTNMLDRVLEHLRNNGKMTNRDMWKIEVMREETIAYRTVSNATSMLNRSGHIHVAGKQGVLKVWAI